MDTSAFRLLAAVALLALVMLAPWGRSADVASAPSYVALATRGL